MVKHVLLHRLLRVHIIISLRLYTYCAMIIQYYLSHSVSALHYTLKMDKVAKEVTAEHAREHTSCKCHRIQQESMCTPHLCTVCACFLVCTKFTSAPCSHGWSWQSGVLSATSLPTSPPHMPTENCCCWLTLSGPAPATDIRWATACDSSGDG